MNKTLLEMRLIRIKEKFQVTIPPGLRQRAGLNIGDYLEASMATGGVITLTPKSVVDRGIAEGLADIRAGRARRDFRRSKLSQTICRVPGNPLRSQSRWPGAGQRRFDLFDT